jgi:hypothetical protein
MDLLSVLVSSSDHTQGGAVIDRRQAAGIAVVHNAGAIRDER